MPAEGSPKQSANDDSRVLPVAFEWSWRGSSHTSHHNLCRVREKHVYSFRSMLLQFAATCATPLAGGSPCHCSRAKCSTANPHPCLPLWGCMKDANSCLYGKANGQDRCCRQWLVSDAEAREGGRVGGWGVIGVHGRSAVGSGAQPVGRTNCCPEQRWVWASEVQQRAFANAINPTDVPFWQPARRRGPKGRRPCEAATALRPTSWGRGPPRRTGDIEHGLRSAWVGHVCRVSGGRQSTLQDLAGPSLPLSLSSPASLSRPAGGTPSG